jgi:phage terminase small subunit
MTLNANQLKFCKVYALCNNGVRSYMEAYPDSKYESARASASDFLSNPNILAKIEEFQELNKADTILLVNNLKKRIVKKLVEQFDDIDTILEIVRERMTDPKLTEKKLLDLSKIRTQELGNFKVIVESIAQIEGLDILEDSLLEMLKKTDEQLQLN